MWRTGVVLFVGCLVGALALPANQGGDAKDDLVAVAPLVAESKPAKDFVSRVVRSFQERAFNAQPNMFDTPNTFELPINGHTVTLDIGPKATLKSMTMVVSLDDDTVFVYDNACNTNKCVKDQKNVKNYYTPPDVKKNEKTKDGKGDLVLSYTLPSGNKLSGLLYRDQVGYKGTTLKSDFLFGDANVGSDPTKEGLENAADGYIGLGFEQTGGQAFDVLGSVFSGITNKNNYITIYRDPSKMANGGIIFGENKSSKCNFNRTTKYRDPYNDKNVQRWWFTANALIGSDINDTNVVVKIDLTSDTIQLPQKYIDKLTNDGFDKDKKTVTDANKAGILKLDLGNNEVLIINSTVYTGDDGKTIAYSATTGNNPYQIVLGAPFLRYHCLIIYQGNNAYSMAFTRPDDPPTKFATATGVSFMALVLIPLVNLFRY
jgi:hypothetical protein